jgi:O-antigen/teichoic acid export membrane protein
MNLYRVREWGKLITIVGSAQAIIQLLALISGILVIRLLPTKEYAFYTLANTMLGTMTLLADGGISVGVMAQSGKVWQDKEKLGIVISSGLFLRRKFSYVSFFVALPILFLLLRYHGASLLVSLLIVLSIIPAFFATLSGTLLEIVPKLHQDVSRLQTTQLISNAGRLLLLVLCLFFFPFTFIALLVSGIPLIWSNFRLRKISGTYANWKLKDDKEVIRQIIGSVKRILPGAIYYCLSGQITIWLISITGSTTGIAKIGALGRLSMMLSVFSVLFSTLIVPRFSRLPTDDRSLLIKRFLQVQGILIVLSILFVAIAGIFSSEVLWILGKQYSDLNKELTLSVAGSCLGLIASCSFSLSTSRNWIINPILFIGVNVSAIFLGILLINIRTLTGVLIFNICIGAVEVVMYQVYTIIKILNVKVQLQISGHD